MGENSFKYKRIASRFKDGHSYEVRLGRKFLGEVHSYREESWRAMPSGIRYGLRGRPKYWTADDPMAARRSHRYSRQRAAEDLVAVSRTEYIAARVEDVRQFAAEHPIVGGTWKGSWFSSPNLRALEGRRGNGSQAGLIGFGFFPAGLYPACSKHGAMNCVKPTTNDEGSYWRCLAEGCNIGAILKDPPISDVEEGQGG